MRLVLLALFLFSIAPLKADQPARTSSSSEKPETARYKLKDIKTPFDPFQTSIEATSPTLVSVILTLGLVYFWRHGSVRYSSENLAIKIGQPSE